MSETEICPNCKEGIEGEGVQRGGVVYCSEACAYECTPQTCVCIHDRCEE